MFPQLRKGRLWTLDKSWVQLGWLLAPWFWPRRFYAACDWFLFQVWWYSRPSVFWLERKLGEAADRADPEGKE